MKKKGFTLIESSISILILIILLSISVSSYIEINRIMTNIKLNQANYEIIDLLVYGKKYCRKYNTYGNFEINMEKKKIVFFIHGTKTIKEAELPEEFIFNRKMKLTVKNNGKITTGETIVIKSRQNKEHVITIRVGVDLIRQKEI